MFFQCLIQHFSLAFGVRSSEFNISPNSRLLTPNFIILHFLVFCILCSFHSTAQIVGPPDIRCVSVNANGNVSLNWVVPTDPSKIFNSYHIYSSATLAGPYKEIDSIFVYAQSTYTNVGANANTAPVYYYIKTRSNFVGQNYSSPSDTIKSIKLDVTNPANGTAKLTWNAIHTPNLSSFSGWYLIYREFPLGTWTVIDSTQNLSYSDISTFCSDSINYQIKAKDAFGCTSASSIGGGRFKDITPPAIPEIDSVSINAQGYAAIGWNINPSGDTKYYVVYQFLGGIWQNTDTVYGRNNTLDITKILATSRDSFRVVAADSCGNTSPFGLPHNTIFLNVKLDICTSQAILNWNDYINWSGGVAAYNIYASQNGNPPMLLGSTNGSTTTFVHTPLTASTTYCYFVQAVDASGKKTSSSNKICIYANTHKPPQFLYLRTATVIDNNKVRIDFFADTSADVVSYRIIRAISSSGSFTFLGIVPFSTNPLISYIDNTANTGTTSYYYKVIAMDSCGVQMDTSNVGRTIYLTANPNDDFTNSMQWNIYEQWLGGVNNYAVYRSVNGVWETNPVFVSSTENLFKDNFSDLVADADGKFCYYIKAIEDSGNIYSFTDTSISNIACAIQEPHLYIPNAFTPKGKNPIFYPVNTFVDANDYQLLIYNRWGNLVFQTNDPKAGWDGTFNGNDASIGVYVYLIKLTGKSGTIIESKGSITLLR